MKYIIYILFIACIATVSFFYSSGSKSEVDEYAVRIDGRTISEEEIAILKKHSPSLFGSSGELPESLIMREILIAEALRQKVDQEEAFRQRIKTFYEQSLVKILVERKMESIQYLPTNEEVVAYTNLLGRVIDLDLIPLDTLDQTIPDHSEHLSGPFSDFSLTIRMEILSLQPQVESQPVDLFGQRYVLQIQTIGEKDPQFSNYNEARNLALIVEYRRQQLFSKWQESLRMQANIVVAPKLEEEAH